MHRRPALTLIEVLVAIFIMGIGLISLLVLFPLGALNMANAQKDDQCAHASGNANALAIAFDLRHDPNVTAAMTNPGAPLPAIPPGSNGPGYPVYVDPIGQEIGGFGAFMSEMPRRSPNYVLTPPAAHTAQWAAEAYFSLLDNMSYETNGHPTVAVGEIERPAPSSYTWAYMLRTPRSDLRDLNGNFTYVNLTVVVYKQRSTAVAGENSFNGILFDPDAQSVRINYAPAPVPNIHKGGWILDGTMVDDQGNPAPHGFFYRVANVVDAGGVLDITLESNPRQSTRNPSTGAVYGVLVAIDDVVEVFERGQTNDK